MQAYGATDGEIAYLSIHLKGTKLTFFTNEAIDLEKVLDTKIHLVLFCGYHKYYYQTDRILQKQLFLFVF